MAEAGGSRRGIARRLGDRLLGWVATAAYALLRALGPDRASALGGVVARNIGPHLKISRRAHANLARFMPELDAAARTRVVREVWDNLGRTAAEYPHLHVLGTERTQACGLENLREAVATGRSCIFFTGHFANWEVAGVAARAHGTPVSVVYRALNNPHIDALILRLRGDVEATIPKGAEGVKELIRLFARRRHVAMLLDQKQNDGIPAPFFGVDAMTTQAPAMFALRSGVQLVPVQVERLDGARFRITVHPRLEIPVTGDRARDITTITTAINAELERWVRANPGQWLWLHRRWPR
jgi:KDO2-lipid IV(A) lauroyltransferase